MVLKCASNCATNRTTAPSSHATCRANWMRPRRIRSTCRATIWSVLRCRSRNIPTTPIRVLMIKIAAAKLPCLSIMNMPPLPYLKRIPGLADMKLEEAHTNAQVWERFDPGLVTLCSPDPQGLPAAGRSGECASRRPADEFQGIGLCRSGSQQAAARTRSRHRRREARRPGRAGEAESIRLAVRAAGEVVDATDRATIAASRPKSRSRSARPFTAI